MVMVCAEYCWHPWLNTNSLKTQYVKCPHVSSSNASDNLTDLEVKKYLQCSRVSTIPSVQTLARLLRWNIFSIYVEIFSPGDVWVWASSGQWTKPCPGSGEYFNKFLQNIWTSSCETTNLDILRSRSTSQERGEAGTGGCPGIKGGGRSQKTFQRKLTCSAPGSQDSDQEEGVRSLENILR